MLLDKPELPKKHASNTFVRWILICCGWCSILAGVIGVFLPIVPTVPFLLLSAACFARSSVRFHTWLLDHKLLGTLVRDYQDGSGIPLRAKQMAIGMIWVSFSTSAFLFETDVWIRILLFAVAAGITLYLLQLPTCLPVGKGIETD